MPEKLEPKHDSNTETDADCCSKLVANTNHIKHISGNVNADDLYALPSKRKLQQTTTTTTNPASGDTCGTRTATTTTTAEDCIGEAGGHLVNESTSADEEEDDDADNEEKGKAEEMEDKDASKDLPPGWEKHEGEIRSFDFWLCLSMMRNVKNEIFCLILGAYI